MTRLIPLLLATLVLAGCGQKGPLYMPNDEQAAEKYDPQHAYEQQSEPAQADDQPADSGNDTRGNADGDTTAAPAEARQ
ncbi:lipoprotein [Larsenimonas sp. GH3-8]|nr:lipoprotein [Larsenimonas rhizosphaerae]MCM2131504.1 lipoprotein [Larsenimonas rhizosphaerae]